MVLILKLNDVPEEAAYHIKFLSSKVGCHTEEKDKVMIDGDTGVMDVDHLSGQIRGVGTGHTILVTDLDYATRASSSKKITTMQYGIRTEMAFENCCVFQVQGERHQDILDTLDRVVVFLGRTWTRSGGRYNRPHLAVSSLYVSERQHTEVDRGDIQRVLKEVG